SIGATVINPINQQNASQGIGIASGIWMIVITIVSLFVGGWVAGRSSGFGRTSEGALHGFVTWGAATLITVYLLTSAVGSVLGGAGKMLSQVLPVAGQMMATNAVSQGGMGSMMITSMNPGWNSIRQEAQGITQKSGATPT